MLGAKIVSKFILYKVHVVLLCQMAFYQGVLIKDVIGALFISDVGGAFFSTMPLTCFVTDNP